MSILAYRSGATSPACLRSALEAPYDGEVDVVVREQGSDEVEHAALLAAADGAARPVHFERGPNLGFCAGHNRAFARSAGVLFLVLNADARIEPGFLRAAVASFADLGVGAVQGLVLREGSDPQEVDAAGLAPRRDRRIVARGQGEVFDDQFPAGEIWGADGAVALFRRDALLDVAHSGEEVFDESFFAYKEDVDLAWRLRRRGWSTRFAPDARAWHHRSARSTARDDVRSILLARRGMPDLAHVHGFVNQRLTQVKNEQWKTLAPALLPWAGREVATWVLALARPRSFVRILVRFAWVGPRALRSRRWVQRRTLVNDDRRWFL
ncbi:hypothetical protein BH24ACT3_BH24ACT3_16930 [soil metagenome]